MPPRLPERYRLNIRLGSDGDVEEWLAQDESLDRPVLIRYLAPESSPERHDSFLDGVRSAAGLTDVHLQKVFAAAETTASAYSVSEWDGGVTIADRLRVGEGLPVAEFLPNAAGLCRALGHLHDTGGVHGAIDATAVHFSAAHPIKLGAFGRSARWSDPRQDTMALAEVLRAAITGSSDASVAPSQVVVGLPRSVDAALADGAEGRIDATELGSRLAAIAYAEPAERAESRPWRALALFAAIVGAISLIAAIGLAADFDPDSPFLYPISAEPTTPTTTTPVAVPDVVDRDQLSATVLVYDPLGDGTENDDAAMNVLDPSPATAWVTETYSRPLDEIKEGVGLVFEVAGSPRAMIVSGTPGTVYIVGWDRRVPDAIADWEHVARGTLQASGNRIQLPVRTGGVWRLWLTGLGEREDGTYQSRLASVEFEAW
jgi:serine/threonine protein kinase